jgi:hypothetical protein
MDEHHKLAEVLHRNNMPAFIIKKTGIWLKGLLEDVSEDMIIINDAVLGKVPVFYVEMLKFEAAMGSGAKRC